MNTFVRLRRIAFIALLAAVCLSAFAEEPSTELVVHYHRFAADYAGWDLWVVGAGLPGAAFAFTADDAFGKVATFRVRGAHVRLKLAVKRADWTLDVEASRYASIKGGRAEVWLVQGEAAVYDRRPDDALAPRLLSAAFTGPCTVRVQFTELPVNLAPRDLVVVGADRFPLAVAARRVVPGNGVELTLRADVLPDGRCEVQYPGLRSVSADAALLLDRPEFTYAGDDLGCRWSRGSTAFRVWSPAATALRVLVFDAPRGGTPVAHAMSRSTGGTWTATIPGNLDGKYYLYETTIRGRTATTPDPYSRALSANSGRTLVFDPRATDPAGWAGHARPRTSRAVDAVLYETHIRDLTVHASSGIRNKGRYLGLAETGTRGPGGLTTGLDHLAELGVTHVHLLPCSDFQTGDERNTNQYGWGYNTLFFDVPEGSYATDPDGTARVREFKAMVLAMHRKKLGVVMDMVYNHVSRVHGSAFEVLAPGYWFRGNKDGRPSNGSGCGNDVATERPMVRKFICDSLTYWQREYQVDGFRFDLWGLFDIETVHALVKATRAVDPNVLLYGEPWRAGATGLPENRLFGQRKQFGMGVAIFNDEIRGTLKGGNDDAGPGYVQGKTGLERRIREGLLGSINGYCREPGEGLNYASCHDNLCLWDKLAKSMPGADEAARSKVSMLAAGLVLTAQGVPFLNGGEEFARTKNGEHNSYNKGDRINAYDWGRKVVYRQLNDFYRGLIALRRAHPAFRLPDAASIRKHLVFIEGTPPGVVAFRLDGAAAGDAWGTIVVAFNNSARAVRVKLPAAGWTQVVDATRAGTTTLGSLAGDTLEIPAMSMAVVWR